MNEKELAARVEILEKEIASLRQSSSISYEVDNAFKGRGFLKSDNLFITGSAEIGPGGHVRIPMPNVSTKVIVLTTSNDATPSTFPQGIITDVGTLIPGVNDLYIEGGSGDVINYIVFLTSDRHPEFL
jgi:hypothetical protein